MAPLTMTATTLVLEGGDAGTRAGIELRFGRVPDHATRSLEGATMSIESKLDEAKGRGEQAQGDLTGDNKKKGEGMVDEAKGKAKEAGDKASDAVHDLTK
jgi:uncharacterized protein YjbJ (UPF0337 family)